MSDKKAPMSGLVDSVLKNSDPVNRYLGGENPPEQTEQTEQTKETASTPADEPVVPVAPVAIDDLKAQKAALEKQIKAAEIAEKEEAAKAKKAEKDAAREQKKIERKNHFKKVNFECDVDLWDAIKLLSTIKKKKVSDTIMESLLLYCDASQTDFQNPIQRGNTRTSDKQASEKYGHKEIIAELKRYGYNIEED